jgi:transcriptional regulator with XRE-family HTH domain
MQHRMKYLEVFRRDAGLTIRDLARKADVPIMYICLIERGRLNPTSEELDKLGRALGVAPHLLLKPVAVRDVEEQAVHA